MTRDWKKAYRKASFKGVEFWVDREAGSGGRRIHVQRAAYSEHVVTEDFGRLEFDLPSRIYVAGDLADQEMLNLISVFESPGSGRLRLPWLRKPTRAHCRNFHPWRERRKNGLIECTVQFVEAGGTATGVGGFLNGGSVSATGVNAGISSLRSLGRSFGAGF